MRFVWLVFLGLVAAMALILPRIGRPPAHPATGAPAAENVTPTALGLGPAASSFAALRNVPSAGPEARADSVVAFGLAQRGTPYVYAGTTPLTGFDCSGFIMYTFAHFGVAVPHSTALLIDVGRPVPRAEAKPGDIVVFTGTANPSSVPGHAGIVVSGRGEVPLRFVHASSARRESGVKVSQVEGTDYERRFMQVRRVLGPGAVATARPKQVASSPAPASAPVAGLPSRQVAVESVPQPAAPLPQKLAPKKLLAQAIARKQTRTRKKHVVEKTKVTGRATKKSIAKKAVVKRLSPKKVAAKKKAPAPKAKQPRHRRGTR